MGVDTVIDKADGLDAAAAAAVEPNKERPPTSNEKRQRTKSNALNHIDLSVISPVSMTPAPTLLPPPPPPPSTPLGKKQKKKAQQDQQGAQQQTQTTQPNPPKQPPAKPAALHDTLSREIGQRSLSQNVGSTTCEATNQIQHIFPHTLTKTPNSSYPQKSQTASRNTNGHVVLGSESTPSSPASSGLRSLATVRFSPSVKPAKPQQKQIFDKGGQTFNLNDFSALFALQKLIEQHGRISHMGILDPSYSFFLSTARDAALYYKIKHKIAVIGGNPLCEPHRYTSFLAEFAVFRKKHHLGIAYLGASEDFAEYAVKQKGWVSMRWGTERALNPTTNEILLEKEGKRIIKQNKALLDPKKGGLQVDVYVPSQREDPVLQAQLKEIYDNWCAARNASGEPQAYMTVFEPFALPQLMIYVYTTDVKTGRPNGFSALRRIGASGGYHIDPYCATPDAPRGTTDLLIYSSMALLNRAGIPYLGLGFQPSTELTEITGMSTSMRDISKSAYRKTFAKVPIGGKQAFYDRWHPDPAYDKGLYLIYPDGTPDLRHGLAIMHFSNISVSRILKAEIREQFEKIQIRARGRDSEELAREPRLAAVDAPVVPLTQIKSANGTRVNLPAAGQSQETLVASRPRSEETPRTSTTSLRKFPFLLSSKPPLEKAVSHEVLPTSARVRTR